MGCLDGGKVLRGGDQGDRDGECERAMIYCDWG